MRLIALLVLAACGPDKPALPDARTPPPDATIQVVPPPELPPVVGATSDAGREVFAAACVRCHGEGGKGSPGAGATDLTRTGYLCRSTGEHAAPADVDIDAALDHGSHAALPRLDAAARRSVVLFVKSLAPFSAAPVLAVPPRPPVDAAARARGRTLFLAFGCHICHGTSGAGDGSAVKSLAWGGKPYGRLRPLAERDRFVCGAAPERIYRTLAIGMGIGPQVMPPYLDLAERIVRPDGIDDPAWRSKLDGQIDAAESAALRDFYRALAPKGDVRRLDPDARRARGARHLWDLVAYVESL